MVDLKGGMQSEVIAWLIVKMVGLIDYFRNMMMLIYWFTVLLTVEIIWA
jgi:hypothetical protein